MGEDVGSLELNVGGAVEHVRLKESPAEVVSEVTQGKVSSLAWPAPPAAEAFYGLGGDFVRAIEPHTEGDPVALLTQFGTAYGNIIGRGAWFQVEADIHFFKLFPVLVGETSKGRKGSSWGQIKRPFAKVDPLWSERRVVTGLSSGEGLIWQVRDPITKQEPMREKAQVVGYQEIEVDRGETDKRLLVVEPEFASTLRVIGREGNTLSPIIRQTWDGGTLSTLTKNSPARATGAHISVIGHITKDELRRYLDRTEMANGFGNRFIWLCVRRSKFLPEGGRIQEMDFTSLIERLKKAVVFGREAGEIRKDEKTKEIWAHVYPSLSEGKPGLQGCLISRGEAQVMRLASIYALLDLSKTIRPEHLRAALALWDYSEASARYIFGDAIGDPIADRILEALRSRSAGVTRTEIHAILSRNVSGDRIERALADLQGRGLINMRKFQDERGRPTERWFATSATN